MEWLGVWLLALSIQPAELPPAFAGKEYSGGPLHATENVCGQHNVVWSLVKGQLPPGIDLSPAGFLSGVVSNPGEWRFTVRAKSGCTTIDHPYTLHVLASPLFDIRPGSISVDAPLGREGESHFTVRVGSNHAGLPYTMETSGQSWFKARARENMIPAAGRALTADLIEVTIDASQLPPGRHKGWIKLSAWRAMAPAVIPIEARVAAPAPVPTAVPITSHLEPIPIPIVREPVMTRVLPPPIVYTPPPPQRQAVSPTAQPQQAPRSPFRMRRFAAARPKLAPKPLEPKPAELKKATTAEQKSTSNKEDAHGAKGPEKKPAEKPATHPPTPTVKPSPVGPPKAGQPAAKPRAEAHKNEEKKDTAPAQHSKTGAAPAAKEVSKSRPDDAQKPPAKTESARRGRPKADGGHKSAPAKADESPKATPPPMKPAQVKH